MAQQVQFRNNLVVLFIFICTSCDIKMEQAPAPLAFYSIDSILLENRNGTIFLKDSLFSGVLYKLNPQNRDTLMRIAYYQGKEHGEWKKYYNNGRLEEQRFFKNGQKIGDLTRWWENGKIQLQCSFENGEYNGSFKEWNAIGRLTKSQNYKNGYEDGSQKMYYDNGKIRNNYVVKNGIRKGLLGTKSCVNVSDSIFKN